MVKARGAGKVAAIGVDGYGIGAVQAADEIGDGIGGVDEAPVHIIAGVEQYENVGADEGVGTALGDTFGGDRDGLSVPSASDFDGGLAAFGEGDEFLLDAVFQDAEILGLEAVNVMAFVVGDLEA